MVLILLITIFTSKIADLLHSFDQIENHNYSQKKEGDKDKKESQSDHDHSLKKKNGQN